MKKKSIAAGHICMDITPVFPDGTRQFQKIGELLQPGGIVNLSGLEVHTGGSVANTGLAMKKMGADVALVGKIGADAFGGMIRNILQKYDADGDLIVEEGETTSYTVVLAVPGIDRIFLHCPGANHTFDGSEISDHLLRDCALFHFGYPTLMKKLYENNGKHLTELFSRVSRAQIATSLDLTAVDPESEAGKADWKTILTETLPYVDFFVPSFEELCLMLDQPRYKTLQAEAGNGEVTEILSVEKDVIPLAEQCLKLGAKAILLKCGKQGMLLMTSGRMDETGGRLELDAGAWNHVCRFEKSYRVSRVCSGTGAGDSSIAAFLTSILEGAGPQTATENAAAAGALCCMSYDTVSSLLPLAQIREMIDRGWEKYE